MSVTRVLRTLVSGSTGTTIHECRQCGETLEADATTCPTCGSDEISTYTIGT